MTLKSSTILRNSTPPGFFDIQVAPRQALFKVAIASCDDQFGPLAGAGECAQAKKWPREAYCRQWRRSYGASTSRPSRRMS